MPPTPKRHLMHVILAGTAAIAMLAFVDATHPDTATLGQVHLTTITAPLPQRPAGGFAADDGDDQAQLQQQLAQQEMQQAQQAAEQQNEAAQQQALQSQLQGQQVEQQVNP